jgi:hypothetical protein
MSAINPSSAPRKAENPDKKDIMSPASSIFFIKAPLFFHLFHVNFHHNIDPD